MQKNSKQDQSNQEDKVKANNLIKNFKHSQSDSEEDENEDEEQTKNDNSDENSDNEIDNKFITNKKTVKQNNHFGNSMLAKLFF